MRPPPGGPVPTEEEDYRQYLWGLGVTDPAEQTPLWEAEKARRVAERAAMERAFNRHRAGHVA